VDFECENYETDTIIFCIYSQLRNAEIMDEVVIDAEDTYVVLAVAHKRLTVLLSNGNKISSTVKPCVQMI
jgi:hypothetical protein